MDQSAGDSPVTLVIKAPNQKYDDQTINCFLNWTVEKLKKHISNVYPSKPSSKDQRLVYSGRLLQDHLQLRDVLRKQDEYHMVHLVCASQSPPESPTTPSAVNTAGTSGSGTSNSDGSGTSSNSSSNQDGTVNSDGLRRRGPTPTGTMQQPEGLAFPMQAGTAAGLPAHPAYMPMQMLWWQQMYARHYYMQYHAALAASQIPSSTAAAAPSSPSTGLSTQPVQANEPAAPMGPNPAPNPVPEEHAPNPNIQMNAQGGAVVNEDELNRDWLDWMYTVSRAAILLSIVYFYSSFGRFIMVIGAMLLVYLHQAGWFPFRPDMQNPGAGDGQQGEAEPQNDLQEMERLMDDGIEEEEGDSSEEGQDDQNSPGPPHPGFLSSAWSFISTFFTSLIPEGPPQAAN
ncbi:homocysteine-responsive endoplasmic reticulum-resident ubiquitin-like domain member 2 protein [Denticeps clupeoides]|uniref:Homocysteine-responsive endoplasmic reticulum-resident ubiquitin-like domain member 2 protein n=1 Tax=Denticeps clupeoides TaxID=299321 RepID=A0AAY4A0U3_9TELE|nr:homocysteine-responsive endoplasmic reticulum-resident ubiquitin-like domain member 2 protein [Denticeps clupeoides]